MIVAAHQTMMGPQGSPLPYDAEVEYIQANGIAYIDTGVPMASGYTMKVKFSFHGPTNENVSPGGYYYNNQYAQRIYWRGGSSDWRYQFPTNSAYVFATQPAFSGVHELEMGGTSIVFDGVTTTVASTTAFASNYNQHLFGSAAYNQTEGGYKHEMQSASSVIRVYSASWWLNGEKVRDFLPVRVGSEARIYDRVTQSFFQKQGGGTFTAGPDVQPLGSVAFSGAQNSNLYSDFSGNQPSTYTWSGWVKTDESPTHGCFVKVGKIQETNTQGSGFAFGFGSTRFEPSYSGSNIVVLAESVAWKNGGSISNLTSWNHYAVVVSGSSFTVFKNGQSVYSASQSPRTESPHGVYMGGYTGTTQIVERFLACNMTRCAMWTRALSASEVAQDYADGKNAPTTTSGLAHYWPMSNAKNYLADAVGSAPLTAGTGGVTLSNDTPFA